MGRQRNPHPKMIRDKSRGYAVCWFTDSSSGKRRGIRLGKWGSAEAEAAYARLLVELRAGTVAPAPSSTVTVGELAVRFARHARDYYGPRSSEFAHFAAVLVVLADGCGTLPAGEFGPTALKSVRQEFVRKGWGRSYVNDQTRRVRAVFKWAVGEELVAADVWTALRAVSGLGRGRTVAPEREPVKPAPLRAVARALRVMPPAVAAMVRFQWLTGCRPQDACNLEAEAIDRSGEVWVYRPRAHKGRWRGKVREVFIGPKAQALLKSVSPNLTGVSSNLTGPLFRHRRGKYVTGIYCKAVLRSCRKAGVEEFSPGQLRHSAGTRIRARFGLEAAQVMLGHARADVTQIYAEKSATLARTVARLAG